MRVEIDVNMVTQFLLQNEVDEPIMIKRQGAPHAVIIPYEIFQMMHSENRRVLRVDELTDEDIEAISVSKPLTEHDKYNDELED